ncbi:mitochondrial ribosomal subunit protein-domain-containing protein [Syncephalis fuscata]|nr:mitochondrial ribosomal subunit protein-domain-containing protein [Syncephalis fuscata]
MFPIQRSGRVIMRGALGTIATTRPQATRFLSTTVAVAMPRKRIAQIESDYDIDNLEEFQFDDHTTFGHHFLHQVREVRGYLRRVKYELPALKEHATPYKPPTDQQILRFQTITHIGEDHPLDKKIVLTVQLNDLCRVAELNEDHRHKLLLLCGTRYNARTGVITFASERFPNRAQNKRYLSDLLDQLIVEAKDEKDLFKDIPLSAVTNARHQPKPDLKFPLEWLRPTNPEAEAEVEQLRQRQTTAPTTDAHANHHSFAAATASSSSSSSSSSS